MKMIEQNILEQGYNYKSCNIHIMEIPEGVERGKRGRKGERRKKKISETIITEKSYINAIHQTTKQGSLENTKHSK